MDISMDIHGKFLDVYIDMDAKFHIYGKPKACKVFDFRRRCTNLTHGIRY